MISCALEKFYSEIEHDPKFGLLFDLLTPVDAIVNAADSNSRDVTIHEKLRILDILRENSRLLEAWDLPTLKVKNFKLIAMVASTPCS